MASYQVNGQQKSKGFVACGTGGRPPGSWRAALGRQDASPRRCFLADKGTSNPNFGIEELLQRRINNLADCLSRFCRFRQQCQIINAPSDDCLCLGDVNHRGKPFSCSQTFDSFRNEVTVHREDQTPEFACSVEQSRVRQPGRTIFLGGQNIYSTPPQTLRDWQRDVYIHVQTQAQRPYFNNSRRICKGDLPNSCCQA